MPVGVTPCLILIFPFCSNPVNNPSKTKTCHNLLNIISQDLPWMSLLHLICLFLTVLFVYNVHKLLKHARHNAEQEQPINNTGNSNNIGNTAQNEHISIFNRTVMKQELVVTNRLPIHCTSAAS